MRSWWERIQHRFVAKSNPLILACASQSSAGSYAAFVNLNSAQDDKICVEIARMLCDVAHSNEEPFQVRWIRMRRIWNDSASETVFS